MKILLTGGNGMLGRALRRELADHEVVVADLPDWDVTDDGGFLEKTLAASPELVIHCAAMTDIDGCEANRERAFRVNEDGSRNVALAAKAAGARLVMVSTGYVFSGEPPREPWAWGELDFPRPRTVYGLSKFAGEQMVSMLYPDGSVILRTAWLYGTGGHSYVHELARLGAQDGEPLKVADDCRGNPTSAKVVADAIKFIMGRAEVSGIVHATCEDQCSKYALALELKRLLGERFVRDVVPGCAADEPFAVQRPRCSALKKSVLNVMGYRTPTWQKALEEFVNEEFA